MSWRLGLLLCIFCLTMLMLIQGFANIVYLAIWMLTALQAAGLIWHLHEDKTPKNKLFCLIESRSIMEYPDFISEVQKLGVKTAIYLDMGAHSSHSKYRNNNGEVINLFGKRGEFAHTWVAFHK